MSVAMLSKLAKLPSVIPTTASVIPTISLSRNSKPSFSLALIKESITISSKFCPYLITGVLIPLTTVPTVLMMHLPL